MEINNLLDKAEEYLNCWWGALPIEALEEITGLEFEGDATDFFEDVNSFWEAMDFSDKQYLHKEFFEKYKQYTIHIVFDNFLTTDEITEE